MYGHIAQVNVSLRWERALYLRAASDGKVRAEVGRSVTLNVTDLPKKGTNAHKRAANAKASGESRRVLKRQRITKEKAAAREAPDRCQRKKEEKLPRKRQRLKRCREIKREKEDEEKRNARTKGGKITVKVKKVGADEHHKGESFAEESKHGAASAPQLRWVRKKRAKGCAEAKSCRRGHNPCHRLNVHESMIFIGLGNDVDLPRIFTRRSRR